MIKIVASKQLSTNMWNRPITRVEQKPNPRKIAPPTNEQFSVTKSTKLKLKKIIRMIESVPWYGTITKPLPICTICREVTSTSKLCGMHIIWKEGKIVLTTIKYFHFYSASVEKHMFRQYSSNPIVHSIAIITILDPTCTCNSCVYCYIKQI